MPSARPLLRAAALVLATAGAAAAAPAAADAASGPVSARAASTAPRVALLRTAAARPRTAPLPAGAVVVAPSGSDDAAGTADAPLRTVAAGLAAVRPGGTVALRAGTYGARGATTQVDASGEPGAPVTLTAFPGERPTLLGYTRISGSHLRVSGLLFDGPTGAVLPRTADNPGGEEVLVSVMGGTDVELSGNEVREGAWHAGIYVETPGRVRLLGNHVHDNGSSRAAQANLDHGIYWGEGSGEVAGNLVEENVAFGVHVYPGARDLRVHHNTIARNGRSGVIVAAESRGVRVEDNLVLFNAQNSIRSFELTGTGNVARDNVAWGNGGGNLGRQTDGLTMSGNVAVDPRLAGPRDYRATAATPAAARGAGAGAL